MEDNMSNLKNMNVNRIIYLDKIRCIAIFLVIVIHSASLYWQMFPVESTNWIATATLNSMARPAVALFIMISGAILLDPDKNYSYEKIFSKIKKLIITFLIISLLYTLYNYKNNLIKQSFIKDLFVGEYHLWYIYMIIGLYLITPLLREITKSKKHTEYFLVLSISYGFIINFLKDIPYFTNFLTELTNNIGLSFVTGYVGYYVLGYYLNKYKISRVNTFLIYILGITSFGLTVYLTYHESITINFPSTKFYNNLYPNILFIAAAIFLFVKEHYNKNHNYFINLIAKNSFGIYLIHMFFVKDYFGNILNVQVHGLGITALSILLNSILCLFDSLIFSIAFTKVKKIIKNLLIKKEIA